MATKHHLGRRQHPHLAQTTHTNTPTRQPHLHNPKPHLHPPRHRSRPHHQQSSRRNRPPHQPPRNMHPMPQTTHTTTSPTRPHKQTHTPQTNAPPHRHLTQPNTHPQAPQPHQGGNPPTPQRTPLGIGLRALYGFPGFWFNLLFDWKGAVVCLVLLRLRMLGGVMPVRIGVRCLRVGLTVLCLFGRW